MFCAARMCCFPRRTGQQTAGASQQADLAAPILATSALQRSAPICEYSKPAPIPILFCGLSDNALCASADHFVGGGQEVGRHIDTEPRRCFEVEDELELR